MTKLPTAFLLAGLIFTSLTTWSEAQTASGHVFLPLAKLSLRLTGEDTAGLEAAAKSFCDQQGLTFESASLPKQGRAVLNWKLRRSSGTFIHITNFREPGVFEVVVYSDQAPAQWHPLWEKLRLVLTDKFPNAVMLDR